MLKRILKNMLALATGQGVQVLVQFLLPPAFIASYGVNGYGEWLVLAAAVGYLSTLDFGLQTYTVNQLTILFHRREVQRFRELQSTTFRMILGVVLVASGLSLVVFSLPTHHLLKLQIPDFEANLALYFLALQLLWSIPFGYINGMFRIIGKAYRGGMWGNGQRALWLILTIVLVLAGEPFWVIALAQFVTVPLVITVVLLDLKKNHPEVSPTIKFWDPQLAKSILSPSLHFGLLILNNYLMFQVPILLLTAFLTPTAVAIFGTSRTYFMAVRQLMMMIQHAVDPEITILYGAGDLQKLKRLYGLNQSLLYLGGFVISALAVLCHRVVFKVWLGSSITLDATFAALFGLVIMFVISRDLDFHYQYATNNHVRLARLSLAVYLLMCAAMVGAIHFWGLYGAALSWLVAEIGLTFALHFWTGDVLKVRPSIKPTLSYAAMGGVLTGLLGIAGLHWIFNMGSSGEVLLVGLVMVVLTVVASFVFDGRAVGKFLWVRLKPA